ncbi:MAG: L-aspartate oxidase, partial [Acidobacteria bacterium]|nr:L-aspartate oxidase [Acidobacteriota bacterium]
MTTQPDFLVLGSGIAALRAALALAGRGRVRILTKGEPDQGSTGWAQGGIAAALGGDDSPALHYEDTLGAGDGLCEPDAVRLLVQAGPHYVSELLEWGARFDRQADGRPALAREAAHSVRRVLHAQDATGREISRVLHEQVAAIGSIELTDHASVTELIRRDGQCVGAVFRDAEDHRHEVSAAATLLATGGAGQVFSQTTNPAVTTGDGMAMAFAAGAEVADLEFVQFHPTVLDVPGRPRFLLSEALRGEGARLLNADGEQFMARYEAAAELAPRDRVARAIGRERERTGERVFLSLQHLTTLDVHARFPLIAGACRAAGLDLAHDRIPVSPAVHYVMGGVVTDLDARTSLPGLYAAGEVACTGVHGANRLASNSLLEGLVFGARAGAVMGERARRRGAWAS